MKNKAKFPTIMALLGISLFAGEVVRAQDQPAPPPTQDQQVQSPDQQGQQQAQPQAQPDEQQNQDPGYNQQAPDQQGQQAQDQSQNQGQAQAPPPPPGQAPGQAPPNGVEPAVGRVSMIHGTVNTQRADSGDVSAATLNTPLENGDQISTGNDSRAEVQLDFANILRLAANSQATIATLDRKHVQVQVGDGLAYFSTYKSNEAQVEVDTPNVAIHPAGREASFRLLVNSGGETDVVVRRGDVDVSTPDGSKRVHSGEQIVVRGLNSDVKFKVSSAPGKDDWDVFNLNRDRVIEGAQSWQHTNRYYTGSEDLDAYGTWSEVPDYGQVWTPAQGPDWTPYSDGSWVYEPYWGWTWTSYEPWGWAPYHYGRWFVNGGGWAWWPGPVGGFGLGFYRPIWAPAYVSFFGFGGFGFGVGFGFGSFGWLPIGPGDFFHPWWGRYGGRFGSVGFNNFHGAGWAPLGRGRFSNVGALETNARVRSGLRMVNSGAFGRGAVHTSSASLDQIRSGHVMTGNMPVVPSRASLSASGKFENSSAMRSAGSQHFFSKATPGAKPTSFAQESSHLQQSIQKDGHVAPVTAENRGGAAAARGEAGSREGGSVAARNGSTLRQDRPGNTAGTVDRASANRSFEDRPPTSRPGASSGVSLDRQGNYTDSSAGVKSSIGNRGETARPAEDGWQRFGASSGTARAENENGARGATQRAASGTGNTARSSGSYRPPLQMNKPIVSQRPSGSYGSPNYGRPAYGGGQSRPAAPSYGGGHSAPSYHAPSGGSSHASGGGHSSGGGGGHSGGGGGHH